MGQDPFMMRSIDTVIFDFDGTIVDSEGAVIEVARPVLSEYFGRDVKQNELSYLKGRAWIYVFMEWFPGKHQEIYDRIVEAWFEKKPVLSAYSGIENVLEQLKDLGVDIGIASSRETKYIHELLSDLSLGGYFDAVVGQTDTERHKPDPAPLLLAASRMTADPENCIYIGDQPTDIAASRSAGMPSGGALWGTSEPEALLEAEPDFLFESPDNIISDVFESA